MSRSATRPGPPRHDRHRAGGDRRRRQRLRDDHRAARLTQPQPPCRSRAPWGRYPGRRAQTSSTERRTSCVELSCTPPATSGWKSATTPRSSNRPTPSSGCPRPACAARTCGPTAGSKRSTGRPRWAMSTSASSRRSAARSARSGPASSWSARSGPPTTPASSARPATRAPVSSGCSWAPSARKQSWLASRSPTAPSSPPRTLPSGRPGPEPAGRLRRARHRLVRRRGRRGRPGQDRRGGR